jgi:phage-related holin
MSPLAKALPAGDVFMETVQSFIITLFFAALTEFAPLKNMVHALFFLVLVDLLTGVWASVSNGNKITARRFSRSLIKTFIYLLTIITVWTANKHILSSESVALSIDTIICGFIAITELKSIFENLQRISKQPILSILLERLSAEATWKKDELLEKTIKAATQAPNEEEEVNPKEPKKRATSQRPK